MFTRRILVLFACAVVISGAALAAQPKSTPLKKSESEKILPFNAVSKTLPNGLKVIVIPTGFPDVVSVYIPVQTGSRNEIEPGKSGFAHFFEHMMFRGTEKYSPEKYNAVIQKAGRTRTRPTTARSTTRRSRSRIFPRS
jgi:zinc protease